MWGELMLSITLLFSDLCSHIKVAGSVKNRIYYFGVGRYAVLLYVPYSLWDIDRDFTTWYGRWKNLRKNICEFGPFRFVQHYTLEDAWKNPNN